MFAGPRDKREGGMAGVAGGRSDWSDHETEFRKERQRDREKEQVKRVELLQRQRDKKVATYT